MKPWMFLVLSLIGIAAAAGMIFVNGAAEVGSDFVSAGWGVPLVVLVRLAVVTGAGLAWSIVTPPTPPVAAAKFVLLRLIREGINALLPVAQVGGEVVGARLLTFFGPSKSIAAASIIVDVFLQTATQLIFAATGFAILISLTERSPLVEWVGLGLIVAAVLMVGFFVAQRAGTFAMAERLLAKLVDPDRWSALGKIGNLDERFRDIYRNLWAVAGAFVTHLAIWFIGALEVWIALKFMGYPVSVMQAISIEALGQAVKGAGFAVPGAYGIQEGGFVALCAAFGVPPQAALALSLIKRVPDFVIGIPALLSWQALEGRRILKRRQRETC